MHRNSVPTSLFTLYYACALDFTSICTPYYCKEHGPRPSEGLPKSPKIFFSEVLRWQLLVRCFSMMIHLCAQNRKPQTFCWLTNPFVIGEFFNKILLVIEWGNNMAPAGQLSWLPLQYVVTLSFSLQALTTTSLLRHLSDIIGTRP